MSQGSSFPAADDTFAAVTEATTAYTANLPNEVAAAVVAIQVQLGVNPSDLTANGANIGGTDHGTVGALLLARARWEVGSDSFAATGGAGSTEDTVAVTFANARFTSAPKVFLMPQRSAADPSGDDAFAVSGTTTSGFTAYRNISGGSPNHSAQTFKYLAIQWPD